MAAYFLDSSALVKRYLQETGTAWMVSLGDPTTNADLYIARITGPEVTAAIARRGRSGNLSAIAVTSAVRQFRLEFASLFRIVELTPEVLQRAMDLAQIHGLRGYDAVQLAAVLTVNLLRLAQNLSALTLISADQELNTAAAAEGLTVENPNSHP